MSSLIQKKQFNYSKLPLKHFVYGIKKIKYVLLGLHPEYEDTILRIYRTFLVALFLMKNKERKTNKKYVMPEFLPKNKWMTLIDKRIFSEPNSLIISWLQMWLLELTGKEKDFRPFWNNQCQEVSQKLWLPTEIGYVGSHLNFWNGSSRKMELNSWFLMGIMNNPKTKNSQTMYSPSFISIPVGKTENEDIRRTKKIRLYPTNEQKRTLKEWMGTRRYVYNKVLEKIKINKEQINFFDLRNKYVTSKNNPNVSEWESRTPKDIRAGAVRDVVKNYNSVFTLLKNKQITKFNMGFSSKKKETSIEIPLSSLKATKEEIKKSQDEIEKAKKKISDKKKVSETKKCVRLTKKDNGIFIYKDILGSKIKVSKRELKKDILIKYDCRLQIKYNKWYLVVPCDSKNEEIKNREDICSLDPGVRSFQTIYSESKVVQVKINKELVNKLKNKLDNMASLRDKKLIKKSSYKKRERSIYNKFGNLIDEMHHKTINYITKNYNTIIIPPFESQDMVSNNKNRRLNRSLLELKHYMFKSRLESKCKLRGCSMIVNTEEYTSKTCGNCGSINNVGSNDIFTCSKCNLIIDRDVNGARNIYIKTIDKILC